MTDATVVLAAQAAKAKFDYMKSNPMGYFILSALAGAYVGLGIILIFAVGAPLSAAGSPFVKLVMGVSFGIALSLVIIAGSELFTGNNMVMTIGLLRRTVPPWALAAIWVLSFIGNLAGSLALAWMVSRSGVLSAAPFLTFIQKAADAKMHAPAEELFWRGVLCNWLVCLAVWSALRTTSEAGKLIMIWWCLFAFIGAGFEHSVANMTLLGIALFQDHPSTISWGMDGFLHNLIPVTAGNIVGGAIFVGGAYWMSNAKIRLGLPGRIQQPSPGLTSAITPSE